MGISKFFYQSGFLMAKGEKAIGLDIGSTAIKVVEVKPKGDGFQIIKFAHRPIPPEIQENDAKITDMIRDLFQSSGIKNKKVYLAVSGSNVAIRRTTLPKMPPAELPEAIKWDAQEEIIFPLDNAVVDYYITGEKMEAGSPFLDMVTVIAEGEFIRRQVHLVKNAGLHLLGINAFPLALMAYDNTVSQTKEGGEVTGYIDMGAERTRIYFAAGGDLLFFREIPSGGQNVTEALMQPFEDMEGRRIVVEESRAIEIKMEHGLPEEGAAGGTSEGITFDELFDRMLPVLNKQAEELYRSVEYFKNMFKRDDISRLTVSGGAGGLKGFYRFLSEMLELRIEQFNPLLQSNPPVTGVSEEEAQMLGPSLTAATGLGIGACDKINLLPEEFRPSIKKDLIKLARVAIVPLILIGLVLFTGQMRSKVKDRETELQSARQQLSQLQQSLARLEAPKQELARLEAQKMRLQTKIGEMPLGSEKGIDFPKIFKELARRMPSNASLEKVSYLPAFYEGNNEDEDDENTSGLSLLNMEGQVFGDEVKALDTLEKLMARLEKSFLFSRIQLIETVELDGSRYSEAGLKFKLIGFPAERGQEVPL